MGIDRITELKPDLDYEKLYKKEKELNLKLMEENNKLKDWNRYLSEENKRLLLFYQGG